MKFAVVVVANTQVRVFVLPEGFLDEASAQAWAKLNWPEAATYAVPMEIAS
jgi:hypothetical protein